ncbi:MFS transporter [Thiohalobacter sp. COW1]|uniref:MFS transporter n=1 Tax=Thiohalobacter sp. COW1 TaxID=2795687 RepID=UPI0019167012|nr:MFS transporter [Thiohalobacter sp. COW1]BCO32227.1 MFS transporter [Thiohalobacter sp. COW1]
MLRTFYSIYSLLTAVALLLLGSGLLGTVVALRASAEFLSNDLTGLIMSGFFLGYVVGSYVCPRIQHNVGHIRSFSAFAAIGCASVILHALWVDPLAWWVLRVLTGISMLGMYLAIESWLNNLATNENRGRLFAVYMTINLLALGSGQYMLLIYGFDGTEPLVLSALFFSLALVPIALTRMLQPTPVSVPHLGLRQLYRTSPLGVIGALISGLVSGAFWGLGPIYATGVGLTEFGIALFMSAVIFGGALLQFPIGHLSDNHDRRLVLQNVSLLGAVAALAVFFLSVTHLQYALILSVALGGCAFSVYSLSVAHTNDHLDSNHMLESSQSLLLLSGIGSAIGPILAGLAIEWSGSHGLMLYFSILLMLLALYSARRRRVGAVIPTEEQGEFVAMARTSPAVLELDPRVEAEDGEAADNPSAPPPA